jgi:hypothetical protein
VTFLIYWSSSHSLCLSLSLSVSLCLCLSLSLSLSPLSLFLALLTLSSADLGWLHVIRVLYHRTYQSLASDASISISAFLTIESLLEQIFSSFPQNQILFLIESLETLSVQHFLAIVNDTYLERSDLELYTEYDGVPQLTSSDLNLILLFYRSMVAGTHSSSINISIGALSAPTLNSVNVNVEGLTAARAYLVTLLCLFYLQIIESLSPSPTTSFAPSLTSETILSQILDVSLSQRSSTSSSSSSSSSTSPSWLVSSRASDIIQFIFLLTIHSKIISLPAFQTLSNIFEQSQLLVHHLNSSSPLLSSFSLQHILSQCLLTIFDRVRDCRSLILTTILSNTITYASKSVTLLPSKPHSPRQQQQDIPTFLYLYLRNLCVRHSSDLLTFSSLFQTYLSSSSLLPCHEFERYLHSILPLVSSDTILLSNILTVCRKSLHHLDIPRRLLAIGILVELFFIVNSPQDQHTILDLLLLILSYPLKYKQLFYSRFLDLFLRMTVKLATLPSPSLDTLKALYRALCQQCDSLFRSDSLPHLNETRERHSSSQSELFFRRNEKSELFLPSNCCIVTNPLAFSVTATGSATSEVADISVEEIFLKEDLSQLLVLISSLETFLLLQSSHSTEVGDAIPSILLSWSEMDEAEVEEKLFHFTETISIGWCSPFCLSVSVSLMVHLSLSI